MNHLIIRRPAGDKVCYPPRIKGINCLKVGPNSNIVGMTHIDTIFRHLYSMGRQPEEATDAELVDIARKSNYIPDLPQCEAYYVTTQRQAFVRLIDR